MFGFCHKQIPSRHKFLLESSSEGIFFLSFEKCPWLRWEYGEIADKPHSFIQPLLTWCNSRESGRFPYPRAPVQGCGSRGCGRVSRVGTEEGDPHLSSGQGPREGCELAPAPEAGHAGALTAAGHRRASVD